MSARQHGGALIELAIAVCLCSVVGCGIAIPVAAQVELARERATLQQLAEIRTMLIGYAFANGRLPCPADATLADGDSNAGHEAPLVNHECARGYAGVIPWATLGTQGHDAWGRRLRYRVARDWADGWDDCAATRAPASAAAASICITAPKRDASPATEFSLEVRERVHAGASARATEPIATGLAFVVLSHGANGHFGANTAGRMIPADARVRVDEARNASASTVSFVTRPRSNDRAGCDDDRIGATPCAFDDLLVWTSRAAMVRDLARSPWSR